MHMLFDLDRERYSPDQPHTYVYMDGQPFKMYDGSDKDVEGTHRTHSVHWLSLISFREESAVIGKHVLTLVCFLSVRCSGCHGRGRTR
jgi:hypothetical protein